VKVSGAIPVLLVVGAAAVVFLHPRPARGFARRVFHENSTGDVVMLSLEALDARVEHPGT
jgi:hypothetical protein